MKIGYIVQARMTSTRLPGKVNKDICGKPALYRMIERLRLTRHNIDIIIATTTNPQDDVIVEAAEKLGVKVFRGSENHVLSRFYYAAKEYGLDVIIRCTSDDLLYDPRWLQDEFLDEFLEGKYDYMRSCEYDSEIDQWVNREPGSGCMVEIFSFEGLERCMKEATDPYCTEHVTPYFYMNPELFRIGGHSSGYSGKKTWERYGTALDTEADLFVLRGIYEELYPKNPKFGILDYMEVCDRHPEWKDILKGIARTPVTYHGEKNKAAVEKK